VFFVNPNHNNNKISKEENQEAINRFKLKDYRKKNSMMKKKMFVFVLLFIVLGKGMKNDKITDEIEIRPFSELDENNPQTQNDCKRVTEFKKQYELIKIRNTKSVYLEWLCKYLIYEKFHNQGTAKSTRIIAVIISYLFAEHYVDTTALSPKKNIAYELVSILQDARKLSIHLLYHKAVYCKFLTGPKLFTMLPYVVFQPLQWYFLDLSDTPKENNEMYFQDITLFYNLYILLGAHIRELWFARIKWKIIQLLKFSEERSDLLNLFFIELLDPLYLHPKKHHVHPLIGLLVIQRTAIHFLEFRAETAVAKSYISFEERQIQWENLYLPHVQKFLLVTGIRYPVFQGETFEWIHNTERLPKLILKDIDIRNLDLRSFSNLKVVTLINCRFRHLDQMFLPPNIIVELIIQKGSGSLGRNDLFNSNFYQTITHLKLHFENTPQTTTIIQYPKILKVLHLEFDKNVTDQDKIDWQTNLTPQHVPQFHSFYFTFHDQSSFCDNSMKVPKTYRKLKLSQFSTLRVLNVTNDDYTAMFSDKCDLSRFKHSVCDIINLPITIEEITFNYVFQYQNPVSIFTTETFGNTPLLIQKQYGPKGYTEIGDRFYPHLE
jgi:hypothetical protein